MFRIEMMPAGNGDSFLITYGKAEKPYHVLIDGGPYYVYRSKKIAKKKTLRKRIRELAKSGGRLELWVMTHIDADHIEAAIRLLNRKPSNLKINNVWFNSYNHLFPEDEDFLGAPEGEIFRTLIEAKALEWNGAFEGRKVALKPDEIPQPKTLKGGLKLTLLSPTTSELYELQETWEDQLKKHRMDPNSSEQALERLKKSRRLKPVEDDFLGEEELDVDELANSDFEEDKSETNASSIAFIAEFEGKKCLFAGDAHSSVLEESLRKIVDQQVVDSRVKLDAFKIPHHGSKHNLSQDLLELVDCKKYLVSTNGSWFSHPDKETISRIISSGGNNPVIYFNYRSEENEIWDNKKHKDTYEYITVYPKAKDKGLVIDL